MALLRFKEVVRSALGNNEITMGTLYKCIDTNELFYDISSEVRMQTKKFIIIPTEGDKSTLVSNKTVKNGIIYFVQETKEFYWYDRVNTSWEMAVTTDNIAHIIKDVNDVFPVVLGMYDNKNDITKRYAPFTTASQVILESGETAESKLRQITSVSSTFDSIMSVERGRRFKIPVPFPEFFSRPNAMFVYIGTIPVYPNRYYIDEDNYIIFNEMVDAGRTINFRFLYNTKNPSSGVYEYIDGAYIVNRSIRTQSLAKTTTSYMNNDPETVATAAAVNALYNTTSNVLRLSDVIYYGALTNHNNNPSHPYVLTISSGADLQYGDIVLIQPNVDSNLTIDQSAIYYKGKSYDLKINGQLFTDYVLSADAREPIYTNADPLFLQFYHNPDTNDTHFEVSDGGPYRISQVSSHLRIQDDDPVNIFVFSNPFNTMNEVSTINVYHNGLKLIYGINYLFTVDKSTLTINLLYEAEKGDFIEVTAHRLINRFIPATYMKPLSTSYTPPSGGGAAPAAVGVDEVEIRRIINKEINSSINNKITNITKEINTIKNKNYATVEQLDAKIAESGTKHGTDFSSIETKIKDMDNKVKNILAPEEINELITTQLGTQLELVQNQINELKSRPECKVDDNRVNTLITAKLKPVSDDVAALKVQSVGMLQADVERLVDNKLNEFRSTLVTTPHTPDKYYYGYDYESTGSDKKIVENTVNLDTESNIDFQNLAKPYEYGIVPFKINNIIVDYDRSEVNIPFNSKMLKQMEADTKYQVIRYPIIMTFKRTSGAFKNINFYRNFSMNKNDWKKAAILKFDNIKSEDAAVVESGVNGYSYIRIAFEIISLRGYIDVPTNNTDARGEFRHWIFKKYGVITANEGKDGASL